MQVEQEKVSIATFQTQKAIVPSLQGPQPF